MHRLRKAPRQITRKDLSEIAKISQVHAGAYVIAMSISGGQARAITGAFVQDVEEGLTVVLTQRSEDPRGGTARDWIVTQRDAVIAALAGWVPAGSPGPMRLRRGQILRGCDHRKQTLQVFLADYSVETAAGAVTRTSR